MLTSKSDAADIDAALSVLRTFSPLFAEESYFFLHRTVGKTEQHRLVPGLMVIPFPAWDYENVVRTPFEALTADNRPAASCNHRAHRTEGSRVSRASAPSRASVAPHP